MNIRVGHSLMAIVLVCLATISVSCTTLRPARGPVTEQKNDLRQMASDTLYQLYAINPNARQAVENAAGYAVFSNFGMKILVAGGGRGQGIAVNNRDGQETFMKMAEIQAGLGMGIKKFRLVWIFEHESGFERFINSGWELGAQATAEAKRKHEGLALAGALAVSPGVWVYQIAGDGLALELTVKGTKYYKNDELN